MAEPVGVRTLHINIQGRPEEHALQVTREQTRDLTGLKSLVVKELLTPQEVEDHQSRGENSYILCNDQEVLEVTDDLFNDKNTISLIWSRSRPKAKED